jgi:hypothetical protein
MGLLDGSPDTWLDLFKNPAQNQNLNAGIGADAAGQRPSGWQAPAQPPFGLAGPLPLTPPSMTAARASRTGPASAIASPPDFKAGRTRRWEILC